MRITPVLPVVVKPVSKKENSLPQVQVQFGASKPLAKALMVAAPLALVALGIQIEAGPRRGTVQGQPQVQAPVVVQAAKEASKIVKVTDVNFEAEVEKSAIPVVLKFGADWCGPCRAMHPELEKFAKEYDGKIKVVEVDIDESPKLKERFNVDSIPDTHLFKKKTETSEKNETVAHIEGKQTKDQLRDWVKKHIPDLDKKDDKK